MTSRPPAETFLVWIVASSFALAGCGSPVSMAQAPTSPSMAAARALPAPSVTSLSVTAGSTGGSTPLRIVGTGLLTRATVSFDGSQVTTRTDPRNPGELFLETPPHAPGTVDITVTNPDGQTARVTNAYTYVSPQEFDFNGTWNGYGHDGQDIPLGFVIRNSTLVSAHCDDYTTLTFSPPVPVRGGAFSFFGVDGRGIEGRIVSANAAVGTSNIPPCNRGTIWGAAKD